VVDDRGFLFVDAALAALGLALLAQTLHYVVAVGIAAAGFSGPDAPALSPPRLFAKVLEVEGAHRAGEADMQFGNLAFGERVHLHAGKAQALVDPCDVLLVAGNAVERLREDQIELPGLRVPHQRLDAGANQARAGDRAIRVALDHLPAFARGTLFAEPHLIFDRCLALLIRRIAGVYAHAHGGSPRSRCRMVL
jgi:hypothetical protein